MEWSGRAPAPPASKAVSCSLPLYRILMVKTAFAPPAVRARSVAVDGSSLTLGLRRLMPSLEHVTFKVPTVTPMRAAIASQVSPRAISALIC
jgi:hypothetical protein